ncbi:hypothetical protein HDU76_010489 [Blyttiomyces sp. JEL0837]|nr:hypothetical protein HDU76_010489 [Blyttiomyces sp. JEL0837]
MDHTAEGEINELPTDQTQTSDTSIEEAVPTIPEPHPSPPPSPHPKEEEGSSSMPSPPLSEEAEKVEEDKEEPQEQQEKQSPPSSPPQQDLPRTITPPPPPRDLLPTPLPSPPPPPPPREPKVSPRSSQTVERNSNMWRPSNSGLDRHSDDVYFGNTPSALDSLNDHLSMTDIYQQQQNQFIDYHEEILTVPYLGVPWQRIFTFLADDPASFEELRGVCVHFRIICSEPDMRAAYFLKRTCKHVVFHYVYEHYPLALSVDFIEALLEQGAILPKYVIERIFKEQQEEFGMMPSPPPPPPSLSSQRGGPPLPPHLLRGNQQKQQLKWPPKRRSLPQGSLEYIVAYGFKMYSEALLLDLPNDVAQAVMEVSRTSPRLSTIGLPSLQQQQQKRSNPAPNTTITASDLRHDDFWLFNKALSTAAPNLAMLRKIANEHHYVPAFHPAKTSKEWDEYWGKLLKLLRADSELGRHFFTHSGCASLQAANDGLVAKALTDPKTKDNFVQWLEVHGYSVTEGAVVLVLASPDRLQLDSISGMSALDLLRSHVEENVLQKYAESALGVLFRDGKRDSLRAVDTLMLEFELSEESVANAFLARNVDDGLEGNGNAENGAAKKSDLPFMTALGQVQGGMTDMMWQLILSRYGMKHPFAAACVVDLVIGGTLKNPLPRRSRFSVLMQASDDSNGNNGGDSSNMSRLSSEDPHHDEDHDDRDRDTAARDSLEAIIEGAGVPIDPGMLGPISKGVLILQSCRPRMLDFMVRVERGLLYATFHPEATEHDRRKWSKVRWVAAFRRHVLDNREWLEHVLSPSELAAMDEERRRNRRPPQRTSGIFSGPIFASTSAASASSAPTDSSNGANWNNQQQPSQPGMSVSANGDGPQSPPGSPVAPSGAAAAAAAAAVSSLAGFGRSIGGMVRAQARRGASLGPLMAPQSASPIDTMSSSSLSKSTRSRSLSGSAIGVARLLSTVVDLMDREHAEIRRFYACCEELVRVLEAPRPGVHNHGASGIGGIPAPPRPDAGPFMRWLREADLKALQSMEKERERERAAAVASGVGAGGTTSGGLWDDLMRGARMGVAKVTAGSGGGGKWF